MLPLPAITLIGRRSRAADITARHEPITLFLCWRDAVPRSAGLGYTRVAAQIPVAEQDTWFDTCPGRGAKSDVAAGLTGFLSFEGFGAVTDRPALPNM